MVSSTIFVNRSIANESASGNVIGPAAILVRDTTVIDLIGAISELAVTRDWGLQIGDDLSSVSDPCLPSVLSAINSARQTGKSFCVQGHSVKWNILPVNNGNEETLVILVPTSDPKTELQIQEAFAHLTASFEATLKQSGIGIFEFDSDQPDWCFSDHLESLLGESRGFLRSCREMIRERIHPDDIQNDIFFGDSQNRGGDRKCELRLRCVDDHYRWFSFVVPTVEVGTQLSKQIGIVSNIDEWKNTQLASNDQIDRRDEFFAMLAHELRNPLMAIRYSVDLLTDFNQARATSREFLNIISRQTKLISRLLDDLLDVSRIIQDRVEFDDSIHNVNEVVRDAVETVHSAIVEKQQTIEIEFADTPLFFAGDISRIKQALVNLLENASKYTLANGRLRIKVDQINSDICIEISDDGIGISATQKNRIFELFYQDNEDAHSNATQGMGIGLFLVKSVIEKHKGRVTVESQGKDSGSSFKVFIPFVSENHIKMEKSMMAENSIGYKTVCLIEDIADSRIALKILLEHRGFKVHEFADAESALAEIPKIHPDAAIIDIGLPGISGLEAAKKIRNEFGMNEMLMIALTGYGQEADCREIDRVGFDHHLIKPAGIRKVCKVISEFFDQSKAA